MWWERNTNIETRSETRTVGKRNNKHTFTVKSHSLKGGEPVVNKLTTSAIISRIVQLSPCICNVSSIGTAQRHHQRTECRAEEYPKLGNPSPEIGE